MPQSDIEPADSRAHALIDEGNRLEAAGQLPEAHARYVAARDLAPELPRAHLNMGNILALLRDDQGAMAAYAAALKCNPVFAPAYFNLGNLYLRRGENQSAIEHYCKALQYRPNFADAAVALGNAYHQLGNLDAAITAFRRAVELQPGFGQAYRNLGNLLFLQRRYSEALVVLRQALELLPGDASSLVSAYYSSLHICDWSQRANDERLLVAMVDAGVEGIPPFYLIGLDLPVGRVAPRQRLAGEMFVRHLFAGTPPPFQRVPGARNDSTRLRVGYISRDVYDHPVMHLLKGVLAAHDRLRHDFYFYSCGSKRDAMTQEIRSSIEHFRDLAEMSNSQAADVIVRDEIDILVDLQGYTDVHQLEIKARRPAPLLVNWLGYPATLGHPAMADYIIGDPVVTPMGRSEDFSEIVAQLPNCYLPNDRSRAVGAKPSREDAGLPAEGLVFCNFNQSYKFSPGMFDLWCRLLREIPGSVLWLRNPGDAAKANLRRASTAAGVDPDRLIFAPIVPSNADHLGRLGLADLALDTFPYTSHTTACDALWVGVPLVTILGDTFASRVAASVLKSAGLDELITADADSCFALVADLARDRKRREALREKLLATRHMVPLFDTARFTRDLETLYGRMWQQQMAGLREAIVLRDDRLPAE